MTDLTKLDTPLRHVLDGSACLFVGAGVSFLSQDAHGDALPNGDALKRELEKQMNINAANHTLDQIANYYVRKQGPAKLFDFLKSRLTVSKIDERLKAFYRRDWKRVYTTNYDNAVEVSRDGLRVSTYTLIDEPSQVPDSSIIHINGYILRVAVTTIEEDIRLTDYSYATSELAKSAWAQVFRTDLRVSRSIIFIGYSLADLDIARIILEESSLKGKCFFIIAPDADEIEIETLSRFGEVFPSGVEALFDKFSEIESSHTKSTKNDIYFSLSSFSNLRKGRDRSAAKLIDDQLIYGEPAVYQIIAGVPVFDEVQFLVPREECNRASAAIIDGHGRDVVIVGGIASGKSFAALQIGQQLLAKGYHVYEVSDGRNLKRDLARLQNIQDKVCLIVDGYRRYIDDIKYYLSQRPASHAIVLVERSAGHEIVWPFFCTSVPSASLIEIVLEKLTDSEISGFDALVNFAGLWPEDLAGKPLKTRKYFVADRLERNLYRLLLEVIRSKRVQHEIGVFADFGG